MYYRLVMHGKSNIKLQFHIYGIKTQGVFLCRIPPKDGRRRSKHVGGLLYDCLRLHLTVVKLLDEKCKQKKWMYSYAVRFQVLTVGMSSGMLRLTVSNVK